MMPRMVRGALPGLLLVSGCLLGNPAFDGERATDASSEAGSGAGTGGVTTGSGEVTTASGAGTEGESGGATTAAEPGTGTEGCVGCVCEPGAIEACYGGPPGTEGVGTCLAGTRVCEPSGLAWGACAGEVLPAAEVCGDGKDQDCSGAADDACGKEPECAGAPSDLVACYPFPAGVDDLLRDGSGNQRHGTMTGVTLVGGMQGQGQAGSFGAQSVAQIPDELAFRTPDFTVVMLVRPADNGARVGLVDKDNQYGLFLQGGTLECVVVNQQATSIGITVQVPVGAWSLIGCGFGGGDVRVWRYGEGTQTNAVNHEPVLNPNGTAAIQVANDGPQLGKPFVGAIDRLMFFSRILTTDEVCALAGPLCT